MLEKKGGKSILEAKEGEVRLGEIEKGKEGLRGQTRG